MSSEQKTAKIVGTLFLTAMVSSLVGGSIIESLINAPNYLDILFKKQSLLLLGITLEFVNVIAVIGIAVMLFSILKQFNEKVAIGYLSFRLLETLSCLVGAFMPLLLLTISKQYGVDSQSGFTSIAAVIVDIRTESSALLVPLFFSLSAWLFYWTMYKTEFIPRFISIWGIIAAVMILILNLVEMNMILNMAFALPIITNELFLGFWLIIKGFNQPSGGKR